MLILVDLLDTWIKPFCSESQRQQVINQVLDRAPFLITGESIFFVATRNPSGRSEYKIADMEIAILDRENAKSKMLKGRNCLNHL